MSKWKRVSALTLIMLATKLYAMDLQKFTGTLKIEADEAERRTLVGVFESCGDTNYLDDDCVIQGLDRVGTEENNLYAKSVVKDYEQAVNAGNYVKPECQLESHAQANRILAHCILLMNYYSLKNQDPGNGIAQYQTCLQGGMQGLVFQGNIVAQSILGDLFSQKGLTETGQLWKRAVKLRKNSDEYDALMNCYQ